MNLLTHQDLFSLEQYAKRRVDYRAKVMAHKTHRRVALGANATLYFEDRLTIQYQVQEMLRIERIFEEDGIREELDTYNPLIPDGQNWKATFMLEYWDVEERKTMLARLIGVERATWVRVDGFDKVTPIANEDLERETEDKTSSVHFLRFELTPEMAAAAKTGATIAMGVDHPVYSVEVSSISEDVRASLVADLA